MRLPETLVEAIAGEVGRADQGAVKRASAELSAAYKNGDFSLPPLSSEAHRLAYSLVRLPGTYAANMHVLKELRDQIESFAPRSVLDLGAGPGTSLWSIAELFPSVESMTAVERDGALVEMGKRLVAASEDHRLRNIRWEQCDLLKFTPSSEFDLVIASYSLGELPKGRMPGVAKAAWGACREMLVIIEPGTRRGFESIDKLRSELIAMGAPIAAPCPHEQQCPMAAANDWCHFAQRIERTREHRHLKDASLSYEDEKFSYMAATRLATGRPRARIVRHPMKLSGHVKLQLCSGPVLEQRTVTRSQKEIYKLARHADWGDRWDF
jgi:ribosomal protein RSM22 (predicted rRNA methylase)